MTGERELARGFELAGAESRLVRLSQLADDPTLLDMADILALPGGFSYGDHLGAGAMLAAHFRCAPLSESLRRAVERRTPIIGICNGFQALLRAGLLPGDLSGEGQAAWAAGGATLSLAPNAVPRFRCDWIDVRINERSPCIWTRGLESDAWQGILPSAHGEGRLIAQDDANLARLEAHGQIVMTSEANPSGSVGGIVGVCDRSGLILGLMPHPERCVEWEQCPTGPRAARQKALTEPLGLRMLRRGVEYARLARSGQPADASEPIHIT